MFILLLFLSCFNAYHFRPINDKDVVIHSHLLNNSGFMHPLIIRRFHYNIPTEETQRSKMQSYDLEPQYGNMYRTNGSLKDAVKGDINKEASTGGWTFISTIVFLVLLGISGGIGFYLGKLHESRNYIRIPSTN